MRFIIALLLLTIPFAANADGFGFQTPSGNIYCNGFVSDGGGIDCTIIERTGQPATPNPGTCAGLWGHDFSLEDTGTARVQCRSTKPKRVGYTDVATYGASADFGDITCTSERTGLTCRNKIGHGFFLSRRTQKVF